MDQITLRAAERTESGSRPARRLRRAGLVPATIYGRGMDARSVTVEVKELFSALHTEAGLNALIDLQIEGGDGLLTVAREIQRDPVRGDITHLDLIRVALDEAIEADVALEPLGIPEGVHMEGGFVETVAGTVSISALPMSIPTSISYDIAHLRIGDSIKVSDLPELEGVEYLDDPDRTVLTVLAPRVEEEIAEEVEGEEGELLEGEEAEGREEGEAPAEGDADSDGEG
jgi:large subunit ribosomal protein L25